MYYMKGLKWMCVWMWVRYTKQLHNMEESLSSQVMTFGQFKGKPLLEVLANKQYIDWVKANVKLNEKQHGAAFYQAVYNITYTAPTSVDSKTPEHNLMQNHFLDTAVTQKLLQKCFGYYKNAIAEFLQKPEFIRSFGLHNVDELVPISYQSPHSNTKVVFEGEHNWDLILTHDVQHKILTFVSLLEAEVEDHATYEREQREDYDKEHSEKIATVDGKIKNYETEAEEYEAESKKRKYNIFFKGDLDNKLTQATKEKEKLESEYESTFQSRFTNAQMERYLFLVRSISHSYCYPRRINDQYEITISLLHRSIVLKQKLCFELKPSLGDDYPCVLRKLRAQIERTEQTYKDSVYRLRYGLIIGQFQSSTTTREQLRTIFNQGAIKIKVLFMEDLLQQQPPSSGAISTPPAATVPLPIANDSTTKDERIQKAVGDLLTFTAEEVEEIMRLYTESKMTK